jgi:hypothetical protein
VDWLEISRQIRSSETAKVAQGCSTHCKLRTVRFVSPIMPWARAWPPSCSILFELQKAAAPIHSSASLLSQCDLNIHDRKIKSETYPRFNTRRAKSLLSPFDRAVQPLDPMLLLLQRGRPTVIKSKDGAYQLVFHSLGIMEQNKFGDTVACGTLTSTYIKGKQAFPK